MDPPSPVDSPENFKKLVNSVYKPTTALPVLYKSSFITNHPWISEDFLRNVHCLILPILLLSVPRLAGDDSIFTPMNYQEGKDVGNDKSECNNVDPTQPQQSTKVSSTTLSEDTEATQVSGSKGAITGKKLKFQPHWQKKYSWINYNSVTNGMLCQ